MRLSNLHLQNANLENKNRGAKNLYKKATSNFLAELIKFYPEFNELQQKYNFDYNEDVLLPDVVDQNIVQEVVPEEADNQQFPFNEAEVDDCEYENDLERHEWARA